MGEIMHRFRIVKAIFGWVFPSGSHTEIECRAVQPTVRGRLRRSVMLLACVATLSAGQWTTTVRAMTPAELPPIGTAFRVAASASPDISGKNAIAFDGTNFLVVWRNTEAPIGIYGARVSQNGTALDSTAFQISSESVAANTGAPSVAFDGTNYLVVWVADRGNSGFGQLFGARVTPAGVVLDAGGIQITTGDTVSGPKIRMATVAFDGTNYLAAYRSGNDTIRALRVTTSVASLDGVDGIALGHGYYPYVAFGGTKYLITWHDGSGYCQCSIMGALVSTNGTVATSAFQIAAEGAGKDHSSVAFDGTNFLVVWHDYTRTDANVIAEGTTYGARVSSSGSVLDTTPIRIADHTRSQAAPRVIFDGTNYFVAWATGVNQGAKSRIMDVYGARVSTAGVVLDRRPVAIAAATGNQFWPVIGFGGGKFLVAWSDSNNQRCSQAGGCVWAQLLSASMASSLSVSNTSPVAAGWTTEVSGSGQPLYAVAGWASDDVYAVGEGGTVVHRSSGVWSSTTISTGRLWGAWATAPRDLWSVGWVSTILLHDNSGWQQTPWMRSYNFADDGNLNAIWASDRSNIVVVGSRSVGGASMGGVGSPIHRYDGATAICPPGQGGPTGRGCIDVSGNVDAFYWRPEDPGVTGVDFYGVWGPAPRREYAVGELGTIVHFDGSVWHRVNVPTGQTLNAIWGTSASDIFVVGDSGTVIHYDGVSWTMQQTPTAENLMAVWGTTATEVFAVGTSGTILRYNGSSWIPQVSGTTASLFGVWGAGGRVYAVGDKGTILSAPTAVTSPGTPTGVSGVAGNGQVTVSFNAPVSNGGAAITGYTVTASPGGATATGTSSPLVVTGLTNGTAYTFTVKATNSVGAGTASAASNSVVADDTSPSTVPTGLTASAASATQINLSWTASTDNVGVTAYKVYRGGTLLPTLGNVTSFSNTGLTALTSYSYTVAACDAAGNCSAQSTAVSVTTPAAADAQAPTVPTGLTASAISTTQVNLSWTASTDNVGVTGYKVYRGGVQVGTPAGTNFIDTGLTTSTSYSYTVAACDAAGNCSAQSSAASATTLMGSQSISFGAAPSLIVGGTATVSATSTSGLAVSLASSTPTVCSISGTTVTALAVGACMIAATQAGNANYTAAAQATQNITVAHGAQSISFGAAPSLIVGGTGSVSAIGGASANAVTFTTTTPSICTISGSTVTGVSAGTCTITANQAGNTNYAAAAQVTQNITIAPSAVASVDLTLGWNLIGNGVNAPLDVAATFGDVAKVSTVWKWIAATSKWAFYAPSLADGGVAYATSKGYDSLTIINGGEGFWVNVKAVFTTQLPAGTAVVSGDFQDQLTPPNKLPMGWSLISIGDNKSPSNFNKALSVTPPAQGTIPINLTTLWAWDSALTNWYFYAPSLESSGGLAAYITSKGYLDFTTNNKTLGPGVGFWVNKP